MVALNFAFEDEAETFLHVAITTVANRNRRREGKEKIILFVSRRRINEEKKSHTPDH